MLNEALGKFHFWVTFLGAYAIFFPMHYLGLLGVPRRYHEIGETSFIPASAHDAERLHQRRGADRRLRAAGVPVQPDLEPAPRPGRPAAIRGAPRRSNGRRPRRRPAHGNWGKELPVVYRWAYDYSVPGAEQDFIPQNEPPEPQPA